MCPRGASILLGRGGFGWGTDPVRRSVNCPHSGGAAGQADGGATGWASLGPGPGGDGRGSAGGAVPGCARSRAALCTGGDAPAERSPPPGRPLVRRTRRLPSPAPGTADASPSTAWRSLRFLEAAIAPRHAGQVPSIERPNRPANALCSVPTHHPHHRAPVPSRCAQPRILLATTADPMRRSSPWAPAALLASSSPALADRKRRACVARPRARSAGRLNGARPRGAGDSGQQANGSSAEKRHFFVDLRNLPRHDTRG